MANSQTAVEWIQIDGVTPDRAYFVGAIALKLPDKTVVSISCTIRREQTIEAIKKGTVTEVTSSGAQSMIELGMGKELVEVLVKNKTIILNIRKR